MPSVTIRTDGSVTLCPSLPFSIGNVRERPPLRDILKSPDPGSERVLGIRVRDIKKCLSCKYVKICGAGCRANAFLETGKLIEVDPVTCKMMEFFDSEILPYLPRKSRELIEGYLT
ncbi:SPASM domain-containing protein [Thermococcus peptonophilus]|uniref:SPASM domain-containing protein n=1 Tax=Thermococcus peptonophilus TaxID=53952 RepID=UPI003465496B